MNLAPNLKLVDLNDESVGIKVDIDRMNEKTFASQIGLADLSQTVSSTSTHDRLSFPKMLSYLLFPSAVIGVDCCVSEKSVGVAFGNQVVAVATVVYNKRKQAMEFTSLEGLFSSIGDLIEKSEPSIFAYQVGIIILGLISGYCIFRLSDGLITRPSRRSNRPAIQG